MLIIVSPAKKLDFENPAPTDNFNQPLFLNKAEILINKLRKCKPSEISRLMKLSKSLTALNVQRYNNFRTPFNLKNAKQALFAFKGDTYVGLDSESMKRKDIEFANKHLRILSGLYGLISPLDLIQPYRLEMGTRFGCQGSQNLYDFWREEITKELNQILKKEKVLINLASKEYFSVIDSNKISGEIITPIFKEQKGSEHKIIGIYAKRARGRMSRYIIEHQISKVNELKKFNLDGYKYQEDLSSDFELIFCR